MRKPDRHNWLITLLTGLFIAVAAIPVSIAEEVAFKKFHSIVDLDFVMPYAVVPKRNDVMIIDSRPKPRKYDNGHIITAISIPDREFDKHVDMLPADKGTLLIFYCGGITCPLSHQSAFKAEALGYSNVKVFADGYPVYLKAGNLPSVSTEYVQKLIESKANAVIIDARPARKFQKGAVPTAISIPDREFDQHIDKLPQDKATPLIYYCGGYQCPLSTQSADKARALGYSKVMVYQAGYPAWVEANKGDKVSIKAGTEAGTITIASFTQLVEETPDAIMIVDVRSPREFAAGSFKTAVNIPIDDLEKQIDTLPADKPIVFICNSGGLSGEAYDMAKMLRKELDAYFIEAQIVFNQDGSYKITPIGG